MKTNFLLLLYFLFYSLLANSQSNDYQWVIYEKGRVGTSYTSIFSGIPYQICFDEFSHPSSSSNIAKNDIFVIYEDGSFFNSYPLGNIWPQDNDGGSGYFMETAEKPIFMYWTNRYEGDDDEPPTVVDNCTGSIPSSYHQFVVSVTNSNDAIQVNHDVVKGKDITVVVDKKDCDSLRLKYDCSPNTCVDLLTLDQSFALGSAVPQQNFVEDGILFNSKKLAFINYRVQDISNYAQLALDNAKVNFILEGKCRKDYWTEISTIKVPIRNAHDPNFMMLNSICRNSGSNEQIVNYANYYLQVQNTDPYSVTNHVTIEMPFSPCLDLNNLYIQNVYFNGLTYSVGSGQKLIGFSCNKVGNKIVFDFGENNDLDVFIPSQPSNSIAAVEFCVKLTDVSGCEMYFDDTKMFNTNGVSFFEKDPYNIETYIGLPKDEIENFTPNKCDCNFDYKCGCSCANSFTLFCCGRTKWLNVFGLLLISTVLILGIRKFIL